jgi:ABC-type branched-subunit amino acid transport system substrate-binding protein
METTNNKQNNILLHEYAQLSFAALFLATVSTTIRHIYRFGAPAILLGAIILGMSLASLVLFKKTRKIFPLIIYGVMNLWVIIGFGLLDGGWDSTVRVYFSNFLFPDSRWFIRSPLGTPLFEISGILTFGAGIFAAYYFSRFVKYAVMSAGRSSQVYKVFYSISALLLIALVGAGVYTSYKKSILTNENSIIKIGVIVPMEGRGKQLIKSFLEAVELAKDDLSKTKTKYKYEVVIQNSGNSPAETKQAIKKLIEEEKINALVGGISAMGGIVKPFVKAAKIPHVCVCSVKEVGDGKFNFTNIPIALDEAQKWIEEAKKRRHKSIVIINQDYPSVRGHVSMLKQEAARTGIKVLYHKEFPETQKDFSAIVDSAKVYAPDIYFISGFPPGIDSLGSVLKKNNISNVSSIVALSMGAKLNLFEGFWYTDSYVDSTFMQKFKTKYPNTKFVTHMMPYAYDSFWMIVRAFESGDAINYLRDLKEFPGTAGVITKEEGSGNYRSVPAIWTIERGEPRILHK